MASSSSAADGRGTSPTRGATSTPLSYIRVPKDLLLDLRDTPLAVGIYTLIMRLVHVGGNPFLVYMVSGRPV